MIKDFTPVLINGTLNKPFRYLSNIEYEFQEIIAGIELEITWDGQNLLIFDAEDFKKKIDVEVMINIYKLIDIKAFLTLYPGMLFNIFGIYHLGNNNFQIIDIKLGKFWANRKFIDKVNRDTLIGLEKPPIIATLTDVLGGKQEGLIKNSFQYIVKPCIDLYEKNNKRIIGLLDLTELTGYDF